MPSVPTFWILWPVVSEMNTTPEVNTHTPDGPRKEALLACPVSPRLVVSPLPARVEMIPELRATLRTFFELESTNSNTLLAGITNTCSGEFTGAADATAPSAADPAPPLPATVVS